MADNFPPEPTAAAAPPPSPLRPLSGGAAANPFDEFDPEKRGANPFDEFDPNPADRVVGFDHRWEQAQTSAGGAFIRGAARGAAPGILSLPAIGPGGQV